MIEVAGISFHDDEVLPQGGFFEVIVGLLLG